MGAREVTSTNIKATVEEHEFVLLYFWSENMGPCQDYSLVFEEMSSRHADVVFGSIQVDQQVELARRLKLLRVPTLMAFRESVLVFNEEGMFDLMGLWLEIGVAGSPGIAAARRADLVHALTARLEDLLSQVKGLDMNDVRARLAARS